MDATPLSQTRKRKRGETALNRYLIAKELTDTAFAKMVGIDQSFVSRIARGQHFPRIEVARKIEAVTESKVTVGDLIADYERSRQVV